MKRNLICVKSERINQEHYYYYYYYYYCCCCCCYPYYYHHHISSYYRQYYYYNYGLDDRGSRFRFPAGAGNFSFHHRHGAHRASYPMGTRGSFPGGKAAGV